MTCRPLILLPMPAGHKVRPARIVASATPIETRAGRPLDALGAEAEGIVPPTS